MRRATQIYKTTLLRNIYAAKEPLSLSLNPRSASLNHRRGSPSPGSTFRDVRTISLALRTVSLSLRTLSPNLRSLPLVQRSSSLSLRTTSTACRTLSTGPRRVSLNRVVAQIQGKLTTAIVGAGLVPARVLFMDRGTEKKSTGRDKPCPYNSCATAIKPRVQSLQSSSVSAVNKSIRSFSHFQTENHYFYYSICLRRLFTPANRPRNLPFLRR